jgi:phosphoadenosine phosphosulfate reductase
MTTLEERLEQSRSWIARAGTHTPSSLALSLGVEDMILLDMIHQYNSQHNDTEKRIGAFVLDTGRLHEESYTLLASLPTRYPKVKIRVYFPETDAVEQYVRLNGINGFYESTIQRKACCEIRKVEPLHRALAPLQSWITGLRREQSPTRHDLQEEEQDASFGLLKFNPLLDWSTEEVWNYAKQYNVPVNALHAQGYPSLGCSPCTRAIQPGEDIRAGRWWWESAEHKECGLHVHHTLLDSPSESSAS